MKEKECSKQLPLPFITEDNSPKRGSSHGRTDTVPSEEVARKHSAENKSAKQDSFLGHADAVPSELVTGRLLVKEVFRTMEKTCEEGRNVRCVPTGYEELDRFLGGGLHCSELVTIAARPSVGKTSVVLRVAKHAAVELEIPVFIFSP